MLKQSSNIGDIVISPLLSKIHLFSMKPSRFFAKKELPLLFRCNFLTPKCSSLKWLLSNRDIFFLITKIFESWISIDTLLVNVSFVLPINNIRECNLWRDSFRFFAYFLLFYCTKNIFNGGTWMVTDGYLLGLWKSATISII